MWNMFGSDGTSAASGMIVSQWINSIYIYMYIYIYVYIYIDILYVFHDMSIPLQVGRQPLENLRVASPLHFVEVGRKYGAFHSHGGTPKFMVYNEKSH